MDEKDQPLTRRDLVDLVTKEELLDILKNRLSIFIQENPGFSGRCINVKLMFDNDEISSDCFNLREIKEQY